MARRLTTTLGLQLAVISEDSRFDPWQGHLFAVLVTVSTGVQISLHVLRLLKQRDTNFLLFLLVSETDPQRGVSEFGDAMLNM